MIKQLTKLDDHNNMILQIREQITQSGNGIECPKCGKELIDRNPEVTLTSYPPMKHTACKNCDYTGYRYC